MTGIINKYLFLYVHILESCASLGLYLIKLKIYEIVLKDN